MFVTTFFALILLLNPAMNFKCVMETSKPVLKNINTIPIILKSMVVDACIFMLVPQEIMLHTAKFSISFLKIVMAQHKFWADNTYIYDR